MKNKKGNSAIAIGIVIFLIVIVIGIVTSVIIFNKDKGSDNLGTNNNGNEFSWKTEELEVNIFQKSKLENIKITDKVNQELVTTPSEYDINNIKSIVEKNNFVKENYSIATQNIEKMTNCYYKDIGQQKIYNYENNIVGNANINKNSDKFEDFGIKLIGNTNAFNNYSEVTIRFDNLSFNSKTQENIYTLIKDIFGEKYAKVLVYAKDLDGLTCRRLW